MTSQNQTTEPLPSSLGTAILTTGVDRSGTVSDIQDEELLRRAVASARLQTRSKHLRWTAVMHTFQLGSTYARQLCRRFGLDPDEMVK